MGNSLGGAKPSSRQFGMPLPLVAKQQVSLIGEESTLCPAFLLEVCPSLCMASHLYYALKGASEEAVSTTAPALPNLAQLLHIRNNQQQSCCGNIHRPVYTEAGGWKMIGLS